MATDIKNDSVLGTNLNAYYLFDEASGNRADSGANGYTLTDNNTVGSRTGVGGTGTAAAFVDTNNEYLNNASAGDISGDLTVGGWVQLDNTSQQQPFFANRDAANCWFFDYNASTARFYQRNTADTAWATHTPAWSPSSSTWYHVMAVLDVSAGTCKIYVNASEIGTTGTGFASATNTGGNLTVGLPQPGSSAYYDGGLQSWGIWEKAFSASDVASHYNSGTPLPWESATGDVTVEPTVETATFTENAPTVTAVANVTVTPTVETATFTENAPTVTAVANVTITPTVETLTITENLPTVVAAGNVSIGASVETGTFTENTPTVTAGATVTPTVETATFTENAVTVSVIANMVVTPTVEIATFTELQPAHVGSFWDTKYAEVASIWSSKY